MPVDAIYFDGQVARDRPVSVNLDSQGLTFSGDGLPPRAWRMAGLFAVDPPVKGHTLRLAHDSQPGARLVVHDEDFMAELLAIAPHLKGGFNPKRAMKFSLWIGLSLAAFAGVMYFTLNYAPQKIAVLLPEEWRERAGEQMEKALAQGAKFCTTPAGDAALSAMLASLAEGDPDMPPIKVRVYDIGLMNAFTLPGGHIVLTRGLINETSGQDEVAGVLAHEIGHAAHRHPEAQLVRIMGVEILLSVATGTSGGGNTGSLASLAAVLRSSRDAERQADTYAVDMMVAAKIDPTGLKRFFEKVLKEEGKPVNTTLSRLGSVFSTHPGTAERIGLIKPAPTSIPLKPAISDSQWTDLRKICG